MVQRTQYLPTALAILIFYIAGSSVAGPSGTPQCYTCPLSNGGNTASIAAYSDYNGANAVACDFFGEESAVCTYLCDTGALNPAGSNGTFNDVCAQQAALAPCAMALCPSSPSRKRVSRKARPPKARPGSVPITGGMRIRRHLGAYKKAAKEKRELLGRLWR